MAVVWAIGMTPRHRRCIDAGTYPLPIPKYFPHSGAEKITFARSMGLWFVRDNVTLELAAGAHWEEIIAWREVHVAPGGNFSLPCRFGSTFAGSVPHL